MQIVFKKDKVTYVNLVQILLVGHVVGFLAITVPIVIVSCLMALLSDVGGESRFLLASIMLPLILIGQAFMLAVVYRLGFWIYQLFRPIHIELVE